jgi:hypothetical protein
LKDGTFAQTGRPICPHGERKVIVFRKRDGRRVQGSDIRSIARFYGTKATEAACRRRREKGRDRHLHFEVEKFTMRTEGVNDARNIGRRPSGRGRHGHHDAGFAERTI